jgi:hypothetical protein
VCNAPLVGLLQVDCGEPRSTLPMYGVQFLQLPVKQHRQLELVLLNSYLDLSTRGVSADNGIGTEGAKALGDALKDNTTLTSLSLDAYCE